MSTPSHPLTLRLRAWIDQPLHLLYFESRSAHDTDADVQGTAGGLNVEKVDKPIEPISWTERWDDRIRETSARVSRRRGEELSLILRWRVSLLLSRRRRPCPRDSIALDRYSAAK